MKTLLILRHAKSSWKDEQVDDHDRLLTSRGERDASRVGELLRKQRLMPDRILSSTARRACETAKEVARSCGYEGVIHYADELYLATSSTLVETLHGLADEDGCVLIVGHNPGLEQLLIALTGVAEALPTAALAHVQLEIEHWASIEATGKSSLMNLWRPR